jgi:flagellar biosynthesis/type III secretory pathway protein FliH
VSKVTSRQVKEDTMTIAEELIQKGLKAGRDEGLKAGRDEGLKTGRDEGLKTGRDEGLQKGMLIVRIQMQQNLLQLPVSPASELAELSLDELELRYRQLQVRAI